MFKAIFVYLIAIALGIWKTESSQSSKSQSKENKKSFYEMSPSDRLKCLSDYTEWIDNTLNKAYYTLSKLEAEGFVDNEKSLELIGNIEKYLIQVEFSGIYLNKVDELENKLFEGVFSNVEKGSPLAFGIEAIRESVYKASKYTASVYTLNSIEFKAKREAKEANNPTTTVEDYLEGKDTSDKEVSKTSSKKKGSK